MIPDHSLLLAHYASEGAACDRDARQGSVLAPEVGRIAAQVAHLTGEERRLLALGPEVREVALALGQQRFETWAKENPEEVAFFRAAVACGGNDTCVAPKVHRALGAGGEPVRLS